MAPNSSFDKYLLHRNLGNSLLDRFKLFGNLEDLDRSLVQYNLSLALIPDGHADKLSLHHKLGVLLLDCLKHSKDVEDLD